MEHETAVAEQIAEKYVLNELTFEQRDAFEEHFFDCIDCASAVKEVAAFAHNAGILAREKRDLARPAIAANLSVRTGWRSRWFSLYRSPVIVFASCLTAMVLLAGVAIHFQREVAAINTPQILASATLISGTRGAGPPVVAIPAHARFFELVLDVAGQSRHPYSFEVIAPDHRVASAGSLAAPPEAEPLHLLLAAGPYASGSYVLHLRSGDEGKPASYLFQIQRLEANK